MRLGLIIYGGLGQKSGGYLYDRKLVAHLRRRHQVTVISLPWRNYAAHLGDNFSITLLSRIKNLKLDILLQDELNHPSLFLLNRRLKTELSIPIIAIVHHLRSSEQHSALINALHRAVETRYLNSVDGFICNSLTTRKVVAAALRPGRPGVVAQPGGDRLTPRITAAQIHKRAQQPGPLRVLFLGNLVRRKAPHLLVQAAAALPRGALQLTFAGSTHGEPQYGRGLRTLARQLGLDPWVEFCGHLNDGALRARLRTSQVLAVPSSYEGFGIAYLEGMGFGLPAIGARAGAAPELIDHGRNGYLIEVDSARHLAGYLGRLHADRFLLAKMGIAARKQWERQPTWKQSLVRIQDFLSSYNLSKS